MVSVVGGVVGVYRNGAGNVTRLEHDPEKACPGLDPGWIPVFGKKIMLHQ
jgi:hypothetical protein